MKEDTPLEMDQRCHARGSAPRSGLPRQMHDVGAIVRWGQEGCTYVRGLVVVNLS